ncbi:MAG: PAS domain-containing protein [Bdellovibrionales bacterium]|nr:PAS domain-containing protein [Bdellovibrionales bacterium]
MTHKAGTFDSISGALNQLEPLLAKITQAFSLPELASAVFETLNQVLEFKSTGFYFMNPETGKLELLFAQGLTTEEKIQAEATAMDRHPGWVIRNQKTYLTNVDPQDPTQFQLRLNLISRLYCPVIFREQCIGTIGVASEKANAFNDNHVAFIEFICRMAAITYENIIHSLEVKKSRERLDRAIEALKFGIWDWDLVKNHLYWDDYMYVLYEQEKSGFSGSYDAFERTLHPEDRDRVRRKLKECADQRTDLEIEFRVITASGKIKQIAGEAKSTFSDDGRLVRMVGANWDVTDLRQKELKMLHASKMSSLGEMSSGIAHEINNPLAIIQGKSHQIRSLLEKGTPDPEALKKLTTQIDETVLRISRIIKGLQSFSREGSQDPYEVRSLKTILEETLAFCSTRFKHHEILIEHAGVSPEITVYCRPSQISQVFLNLLNNSFDAVQGRKERWVKIDAQLLEDRISISFTDSGPGIPEGIREKILEPFFTTKEVGKGTGLGLSISLGILKSHGGSLKIDTFCKNTRFLIDLPKAGTQNIS